MARLGHSSMENGLKQTTTTFWCRQRMLLEAANGRAWRISPAKATHWASRLPHQVPPIRGHHRSRWTDEGLQAAELPRRYE
jgi:hypothetical protein